jgi:hypothetical protein
LIPWAFIVLTPGSAMLISVSTGFSAPGFYVFLVFTIICWYLAPKIWIAHEASRTLSEERRDGTLEMVLSTPMCVGEIIRGQWLALRRCYLVAVIFPVVMGTTLVILINFVPTAKWLNDIPYATPVLIAGTILFVTDCVTMGWVGMWCGLKLGNPKAAARATTSRVITLPTLCFAVCFALAAILVLSQRFNVRSPYVPIGLWLGIGLTFDLVLIQSSRTLLHREFRDIVQEPALARDAWARTLGRWLGGKFQRKPATPREQMTSDPTR